MIKVGKTVDTTISVLKHKEIINITDGTRYGFISDIELNLTTGAIANFVILGRLRLFGLLGREDSILVPWGSVRRFGDDVILVDGEQISSRKY